MNSSKLYVQFGAGNEAVEGWLSYDSSPTLLIQKTPILGRLLRSRLNCVFDADIRYGDIVKGLSLRDGSVDGLFCSHVLEHLSHTDFSKALKNSFRYLKGGGVFRIIVPDLEYYIKKYQHMKSSTQKGVVNRAAYDFLNGTCLGLVESRQTIRQRLIEAFRNSFHRWMYDYHSLTNALASHGFVDIKRFSQGICDDEMFLRPERDHQFIDKGQLNAVAIECRKPL